MATRLEERTKGTRLLENAFERLLDYLLTPVLLVDSRSGFAIIGFPRALRREILENRSSWLWIGN